MSPASAPDEGPDHMPPRGTVPVSRPTSAVPGVPSAVDTSENGPASGGLAAAAPDEGPTYAQKRRPRSFAASGRATGESKRPWYRAQAEHRAALAASAPDEGPGPYNYSDGFNDAVAARPAAPPAPDEGPRYVTHDEVEAVLNAMPGGRPPGIIVGPDAASAPDEGPQMPSGNISGSKASPGNRERLTQRRAAFDHLRAILRGDA